MTDQRRWSLTDQHARGVPAPVAQEPQVTGTIKVMCSQCGHVAEKPKAPGTCGATLQYGRDGFAVCTEPEGHGIRERPGEWNDGHYDGRRRW